MASNQSSNIEDEALNGTYDLIPVPSVYDHDTRFENRNAEEVHHEILEAARLEHERVRNEAVRVFQLTLIQEQQLRAQHEIMAEEERLRIEEVRLKIEEHRVKTERQNALAELKRRELEEEARKIPVVPPKPPTPPPVAAPAPAPAPAPKTSNPQVVPETFQQLQRDNASGGSFGAPNQQMDRGNSQQGNNLLPLAQPLPSSQTSGFSNTRQQPSTLQKSPHLIPGVERYVEIHQNLKKLRKYLIAEGKQNLPFKKLLGDYRRAIRQTCGQLTGERGANKNSVCGTQYSYPEFKLTPCS